jgi:hypothetical protein
MDAGRRGLPGQPRALPRGGEGQISYLRRGAEVKVVAGGPRKEGLGRTSNVRHLRMRKSEAWHYDGGPIWARSTRIVNLALSSPGPEEPHISTPRLLCQISLRGRPVGALSIMPTPRITQFWRNANGGFVKHKDRQQGPIQWTTTAVVYLCQQSRLKRKPA